MSTPEQRTRAIIDGRVAAGWVAQDRDEMSIGVGLGVAVREYPLAIGPCDYLLFVDRKACGVVEAKPEGVTLSGVAEQASRYQHELPDHLAAWGDPLRFDYEDSASEILFSDRVDPNQRSRYLFGFHRPETLLNWLRDASSLRLVTDMPALVTDELRDCQVEAITVLERLCRKPPARRVQMTMGAGKTFPAAAQAYRLPAHAHANRTQRLVDRNKGPAHATTRVNREASSVVETYLCRRPHRGPSPRCHSRFMAVDHPVLRLRQHDTDVFIRWPDRCVSGRQKAPYSYAYRATFFRTVPDPVFSRRRYASFDAGQSRRLSELIR